MRLVGAAMFLTVAGTAANAQTFEELANEVSRTTQEHLGTTNICRDDLGSSWYQAARTIAERCSSSGSARIEPSCRPGV